MDKSLILNEIKKYLGFKTDKELADFLGVKQNTFSTWRHRNTLDKELILSKCDFINANWLLTGEGSMLKDEQEPQTNTTDDKYLQLLEEHNKTLKEQLRDKEAIIKEKEEKEALYKEKIQELQQRMQTNTLYQSGAPTASYSLPTPPVP